MKTIQYSLADGIATITFDEPNSPVNTMCLQWQEDMDAVAAQVVKDKDAIKGILLASNKTTFFAGADLKGAMRLQPSDAPQIFEEIERVKRNFRTIETLGKPVVSLLNGTALGGGWEVALVGHHRIAIDDRKTQFGLPEVTLGLLPGASGVTKMTRHLGLMGAQPYLVEGKTFSPAEAKGLGLVHDLVAPGDNAAAEMKAKGLAWIAANPTAQHPWEAKGYKVPGGLPSSPAVAQMLVVAPAMIKKQTRGLFPAAEAIMACMVEGLQVDMETALRIESRHLAKLMTGINAKAMINTFFFNLNAIKSGTESSGRCAPFQAHQSGPAGRRHDGRGHCLQPSQQRHCHGPEGCEPRKSRLGQKLQRQDHARSCRQRPHEARSPAKDSGFDPAYG